VLTGGGGMIVLETRAFQIRSTDTWWAAKLSVSKMGT
jgi:hypothetical protein